MSIYVKKAQTILEYTLILGAVVAVVVFVLLRSGGIKDTAETSYNAVNEALNATIADLHYHGIFNTTGGGQ